jgi:1-phosphofructokinase
MEGGPPQPDVGVVLLAPAPFVAASIERSALARAGSGAPDEIHIHAGGQGVWQARMLVRLGVRVVFCTSLGGELAAVLRPLLAGEGFELHVVPGPDAGGRIHDRRNGQRERVASMPGHPLTRHQVDDLCELAFREGLKYPVAILSGPPDPSLFPAEAYEHLAADLNANGRKVIVDLSGDQLTAALAGHVFFVKVSHEELLKDGRAEDESEPAMMRALQSIREEGAECAIVSRAGEPALALLGEQAYRVHAPVLHIADSGGAGDSMTAGIAAVLSRGGDPLSALRTGAAAGALNVTRHGLGTGQAETIATLINHVLIEPWKETP